MLVGKWLEWRTGDTRVSIAILLPSGIEKEYVFSTIEEGTILHVTVLWPSVLTDVNMLCKMYLDGDGVEKVEPYHDMLTGFRKVLETVQAHKGDRMPVFLYLFLLSLTVRAIY